LTNLPVGAVFGDRRRRVGMDGGGYCDQGVEAK